MKKNHVFVSIPNNKERSTFFTPMIMNYIENIKDFTVSFNPYNRQLTEDEKRYFLNDKDALVVGWGCGKYSSEMLKQEPNFKVIGVLGGAIQPYIDEDFFNLEKRFIITGAKVMARSVAEAVLTYALSSLRDISNYDHKMKRVEQWRSNDFFNEGLFYKKVGFVGLGQVGRFLLEMLKPFNVNVLIYDPYVSDEEIKSINCKKASLEEVMNLCDVISIHAAFTQESFHLINGENLKLMKKGALLVNTSRGGIIDEHALIDVLKQGHIKAALDVYEEEPLTQESQLRNLENVLLIPHMAGPTIDMRQYMTLDILQRFQTYFQSGKIHDYITKDKYKIMTGN